MRRLISLLGRSSGSVDQILFQWLTGKEVKASRSVGLVQYELELGELAAEHSGDDLESVVDVGGVGLDEDGADGGRDHLG